MNPTFRDSVWKLLFFVCIVVSSNKAFQGIQGRSNHSSSVLPLFPARHSIPTAEHSVFHWSPNCPPSSELGIARDVHGKSYFYNGDNANCCCSISDYGAIGDNSTLNTIAIQTTIDDCHKICLVKASKTAPSRILSGDSFVDGEKEDPTNNHSPFVTVYVPKGMFRTGSIALRSNTRIHIARGASLYGSGDPNDYPDVPMLPNGYQTHKTSMFRALLSGSNIQNVSITGENPGFSQGSFATFDDAASTENKIAPDNDDSLSIIDGVGWKWWCWYDSMPIYQSFCDRINPNNDTMPQTKMRPKLIEFYNSTNIVLDRFTARNSPVWFIHPFLSKNIAMTNLTVLAPRAIGNTDGLDPDSCENVLMDSCYIDVGDDGVSIKSSNHSGMMVPTRNVTMRNLRIVSRNWCIGSATFGGIYDILFEDSTIGDPDMVTSPWAIKFKSHRYYPGPMENIMIRRINMGQIGPTPYMYPDRPGTVFVIVLSYSNHTAPRNRSGKPLFRNVTLQDISAASAGVAGEIMGFPEDCLEGLALENIHIHGGNSDWICKYIDLQSLTVSNVEPPVFCEGNCSLSKYSEASKRSVLEGELGSLWQ